MANTDFLALKAVCITNKPNKTLILLKSLNTKVI